MSLNFLVVAYTPCSLVITTFLFAKVASAGMTAMHRCPIFLDSLWQPSHFITKMGIPYTLPKNYLLFIPMALTAFLGKEKVYTRQDMGIKKSSHESYNRTKEKCLTTLRKSIYLYFVLTCYAFFNYDLNGSAVRSTRFSPENNTNNIKP